MPTPNSPRCRQLGAERRLGNLGQELVWQAQQDAGAVARVLFVADTAAMLHAAVHVQGVFDDGAAWPTLDVTNEADAAAVFLVGGVVQPLPGGKRRQGFGFPGRTLVARHALVFAVLNHLSFQTG